jgi:colicin import membrane protein/protein TonB
VSLASSALHRKDRIWPAVAASVAVHAAVGSLALVNRPPPRLDLDQRPIVAKLVRLGEARPKELLPRKDEAPPPAAAPEPAPAPAPAPAAAPVSVPGPKAVAAPRAARPAAAERSAQPRAGGTRLASVLSQLKQEMQAGSPDGDPLGDSSEAVGDQYHALVVQALRQNYRLPPTISERDRLHLTGTVVLFIDGDGRILRYEVTRKSGNPIFDDALERAVRDTRFAPPPAASRDAYRRVGLEVQFRIAG